MYNTFSFVGTIKPIKNTENFKGYEERKFSSGWTKRTLKFNMVCGNNRHMVQAEGGCYPEKNDGLIYTMIEENVGGKRQYTKTQFPFKDRFNPDYIKAVPMFAKYIVDTEISTVRYKIKDVVDKMKLGEIPTDCEYKTLEEAETALSKSNAKRKEFLSEWDFVEYLNKLVSNDKIKNMKFKVSGNVVFSYWEGKYYRNFVVNKVYRVPDDTPTSSSANLCLFFTENAIDDNSYESNSKYYINGFVREYDSSTKSYFGVPITLVNSAEGDEKTIGRAKVINKRFNVDDDRYYEVGLKCEIIDGSQEVEITEDMLSDDQKESLEYGLITMEDIKAELDGSVYGDRIQETRIVGFAKGYSNKALDTTYTAEDFAPPTVKTLEDEIDDIFDDDDDIEI